LARPPVTTGSPKASSNLASPSPPSRIRAAAGNPNIAVHSFPWPLVTLLSPFVTLLREMREMRYLWRQPLRLSNEHLLGVLTIEPQTPLEQAVRTTLSGLGCLKRQELFR
jgi:hypothetical protein